MKPIHWNTVPSETVYCVFDSTRTSRGAWSKIGPAAKLAASLKTSTLDICHDYGARDYGYVKRAFIRTMTRDEILFIAAQEGKSNA